MRPEHLAGRLAAGVEIARITTAVQTAQKSEEESTATAVANEARALAVRADE